MVSESLSHSIEKVPKPSSSLTVDVSSVRMDPFFASPEIVIDPVGA